MECPSISMVGKIFLSPCIEAIQSSTQLRKSVMTSRFLFLPRWIAATHHLEWNLPFGVNLQKPLMPQILYETTPPIPWNFHPLMTPAQQQVFKQNLSNLFFPLAMVFKNIVSPLGIVYLEPCSKAIAEHEPLSISQVVWLSHWQWRLLPYSCPKCNIFSRLKLEKYFSNIFHIIVLFSKCYSNLQQP